MNRFACVVIVSVVVTACSRSWRQALAPIDVGIPNDSAPHVIVSQREVLVIIPAPPVAWPDGRHGYLTPSRWFVSPEQTVGLSIGVLSSAPDGVPDTADVVISSLESFGKTLWGGVCEGGMIVACLPRSSQIRAAEGRIVITLRDSAAIVDLFGLRPDSVSVGSRQGSRAEFIGRAVAVTYIAPNVPSPDSAFRARRAFAIAERERRSRSVVRALRLENRAEEEMPPSLAVGDSLLVRARERQCRVDLCFSTGFLTIGRLRVSDTTVAVLHPALAPEDSFYFRAYRVPMGEWLVARRPGRVTLRATSLTPYAGPSTRESVPDSVSLDVDVRPDQRARVSGPVRARLCRS